MKGVGHKGSGLRRAAEQLISRRFDNRKTVCTGMTSALV